MGVVCLKHKVKTGACFLRMLSNSKGRCSNIGDWQVYAMELAYFHIRNFEKTYGKDSFVSLPCKLRACLFCATISLLPRIEIPMTIALRCYMLQCNLKSLCHNSSTTLFPLNQPQTLVTNQRKTMMQYELKCLDINI